MYDSTQLGTSALQQVRWLLGGTKVDTLVTDSEITFALDIDGQNIYLAGAGCAENLSSSYIVLIGRVTVGPLSTDSSAVMKGWADLAKHLRNLGMKHSIFNIGDILPGVSIADIEELAQDMSFPAMYMRSRMFENREVSTSLYNNNSRWWW
jgi:hypothetical protein